MKTLTFFLIFFLGFAVFYKATSNGFVGDDPPQTVDNVLTKSLFNVPRFFFGGNYYNPETKQLEGSYYRPIISTFFTIVISIFGAKAYYLHFFQIIFYILNAYLVFLVLRKFVNEKFAILLAIIFLVHPINIDSAIYIAISQDTLFFFFGMLAVCTVLYKQNLSGIFWAHLFLCLSLLSKETGLLFFIPIFFLTWLVPMENRRSWEIKLTLHVFLSALLLLFYIIVRLIVPLTNSAGLLDMPIMRVSFDKVLLTQPAILFFYIKTFIFPKDLSIMHSSVVEKINFPTFYFPLIVDVFFISAVFFLGFTCWRRKNNFAIFCFFAIWFLVGIFFHMHLLLRIDGTVAERWFYFPMVGLLGLIGTALEFLPLYKKKYIVALAAVSTLVIILLTARTFERIPNYADEATLDKHDIQVADDPILEKYYGYELLLRGEKNQAESHLKKAVELDPSGRRNWADLASLYAAENKIDQAKAAYETSIANGKNETAYESYAKFLIVFGTPQEAVDFTRKASEAFPRNILLQGLRQAAESRSAGEEK